MGRSGGTLISKCLGCMEDVILLSEVHPENRVILDPLSQARRWFGLFTAEEAEAMQADASLDFAGVISRIDEAAAAKGKTLVLRDWAHWDFIGIPFHHHPDYRMRLVEVLAGRFELIRSASVRHPIDQWLSTRRMHIMAEHLDPETFLRGCRRFAEAVAPLGFIRYEDFVRAPETVMRALCEQLDVPYDAGFLDRWSGYTTISGDQGRGERSQTIQPSRRAEVEPELLDRFAASEDYRRTCELLGYGHPM